ncbi:MAG: hypothetical protein KDD47_07860 [Acidobacteria bacterium]|nr:hypothetical protein [Acidobacteriota bacterium]
MSPWKIATFSFSILLACGTAAPSSRAQEAPPACSELGELQCMESADCTLLLDDEAEGGYRCREAVPPCETGFKQGSDSAEACTAKAGCVFQPGRCYCRPDVVCICGGGPPPSCVAAETAEPSQG